MARSMKPSPERLRAVRESLRYFRLPLAEAFNDDGTRTPIIRGQDDAHGGIRSWIVAKRATAAPQRRDPQFSNDNEEA